MGQHGAPFVHLELTLANFGLTADNLVLIWVDKGLNPVNSGLIHIHSYTSQLEAHMGQLRPHIGQLGANLVLIN